MFTFLWCLCLPRKPERWDLKQKLSIVKQLLLLSSAGSSLALSRPHGL